MILPSNNINLVIFDCDGTLVDSEWLGHEALVATFSDHGYSITVDESIRRFKGVKYADCIAEIERETGRPFPTTFEQEFRANMAALFEHKLEPIQGAHELLTSLSVPYCLASNGPRMKIENSLRITGLKEHFGDNVFSSFDVGIWKPDPGFFHHILQKFEVDPQNCIIVEDSLPGILGGFAAGAWVWTYGPGGIEPDWPNQVVNFTSLFEMRDAFRQLGIAD